MSSATTPPPAPPHTPAEAARNLRDEARFGAAFLRRHGLRLLLVFLGIGLPLWGFGALVEELHEGEVFFFDEPVLRFAHGMAGAGFDRLFLLFSQLGYQYGVVPVDIALVLALAWRRRLREGLFAGIATGGSALLNVAAKHAFARIRPDLWPSIAPETTYSFPSGHAMGSITLAWVVLLLWWHLPSPRWRRWRWPVTIAAVLFTLMVGLSRIYLGVHFPSDILAGWTAASVWTVGVYALVFNRHLRPWRTQAAGISPP